MGFMLETSHINGDMVILFLALKVGSIVFEMNFSSAHLLSSDFFGNFPPLCKKNWKKLCHKLFFLKNHHNCLQHEKV